MEQTDFLKDMQKLLHGEGYNKKFKLKDNQSIWIQQTTRKNMYNLLKYMYEEDLKKGKKQIYSLERLYSNLNMDHRIARHALILLCMGEQNPIRIIAWQNFKVKIRGSPKKHLMFQLVGKHRLP